MNLYRKKLTIAAGIASLAAFAGCSQHTTFTHAPPGTPVDIALAKKAQAVPTPTPKPVVYSGAGFTPDGQEAHTESIADYYTLGNLMMEQEKYTEAIKAYENAVKLDPTFSDAWNHLAICYQNTGQTQKALDAFKKYKTITRQ